MRNFIATLLLVVFMLGFSTSSQLGKKAEPAILPESLDLEKILLKTDSTTSKKNRDKRYV